MSVRPYTISHLDTYFHEPHSFKPERWLPESQRPTEFQNDQLPASNPFSVGPTGCLGRGLAWAEMRIFLCRLLWAFDVEEVPEKRVVWSKLKTMMIVQKEPMELRLKSRMGVPPKTEA